MREAVAGRHVGARVQRVEDDRLLSGTGRYVDDVSPAGTLHACFLRSPYAHAEIVSIDTARALRARGVHAVLTGQDMTKMTNPFLGMLSLPEFYDAWHWALAVDRVRLVGDPVAIVVAESRALAEDAAELIEVTYEPLEPITSVADARDPSRPAIWPRAGGNVVFSAEDRYGDVDGAFGRADRVIRQRFDQHRHANQPMETRGSVAEIDPATGTLTLHSSHQAAHVLKWTIAMATARQPVHRSLWDMARRYRHTGHVLAGMGRFMRENAAALSENREGNRAMMRQMIDDPERGRHLGRAFLNLMARDPESLPEVVVADVGGAFGAKGTVLREDVALCAAALATARSVKWIEDRNEHLLAGGQAREEAMDIEMAVTDDGDLLAIRAWYEMDTGAYMGFPFAAPMFSKVVRTMLPGPYRLDAFEFHTTVAATNKATFVPYRGPWAIETWVRERMLDIVASELGFGRDTIRLRNMIGPDELPTPMLTGPTLDVRMSAKTTFERALVLAEFESWPATKADALAAGVRRGLGFATYIEPAPGPEGYLDHIIPGMGALTAREPAVAALEVDGSVTVHIQQVPHGQSHETTLAQVVADELGVRPEDVSVRYGRTDVAPFGLLGTAGSRSAAMAGGAVGRAGEGLRQRIVEIAARLLEASPDDVVITDGNVHVAGVPARGLTFADVAQEVQRTDGVTERGEALRVDSEWDGGPGGWAQATHVCWVDVDLETGFVTIPRYLVVEDCGEIINPAIVEGQVRGGVAQGVGAVLYERIVYDDDGNPLTGTYMDYLLPTVMEIPPIEIHHVETPSDVPYNFRGVGEGGMIGAPAAITNAIEDALSDLGVRITEQHLPPTRILELAGVIEPD